jgi:hypothetical protein
MPLYLRAYLPIPAWKLRGAPVQGVMIALRDCTIRRKVAAWHKQAKGNHK